jgi:hypothetical protein
MVFGICRRIYFVGIPVRNEHLEQCQGEGEQFQWSLEFTDEYIPLVYPYVMYNLSVFPLV